MSKKKRRNKINKEKAAQTKRFDAVIIALLVAIAVAIAVTVVALAVLNSRGNNAEKSSETAAFVPPPFEEGAEQGTPHVPENMGYREIYQEGMSFRASICGEVNISEGKADVYFTNSAQNSLWMKLRVFDASGKVIAETGLIKPGEYLKTVSFDTIPKNGEKISMKIMTYEPDTYYSGGAVALNTVAKVN